MHIIKKWKLLEYSNATTKDLEWLHAVCKNVSVEYDNVELITLTGKWVAVENQGTVTFETDNKDQELLVHLKFSGRVVLLEEIFYSTSHGCRIEF